MLVRREEGERDFGRFTSKDRENESIKLLRGLVRLFQKMNTEDSAGHKTTTQFNNSTLKELRVGIVHQHL